MLAPNHPNQNNNISFLASHQRHEFYTELSHLTLQDHQARKEDTVNVMEEFQNIHISFTRQLQLIQQDNSIEVIQQNANGEALTLEDWKTILQIVA